MCGKVTNTSEFIVKSVDIHGPGYDYSKTNYVNSGSKVTIICSKHGEFYVRPNHHISKKVGCPECSNIAYQESRRVSGEIKFLSNAKTIHGDKYNYDQVDFVTASTNVIIRCNEHNHSYSQLPRTHLKCTRCSCPKEIKDKFKVRKPRVYTNNSPDQLRIRGLKFIKQAYEVHGDKYDYSMVEYLNSQIKVKIICPDHGVFEQTPNGHLKSRCPRCVNNNIKLSTGGFIKQAREVHGDVYDYSMVDYKNNKTNVKIICQTHGVFEQIPSGHKGGQGCPKCVNTYPLDTESFIDKSRCIHGDKYNYSLVVYEKSNIKVKIICPDHGVFTQTPHSHLRGRGCCACYRSRMVYDMGDFVSKATTIHSGKYDYSKVVYTNTSTNVKIICPEHGVFTQTPHSHLRGRGCVVCGGNQLGDVETFSRTASVTHNNFYSYGDVVYVGNKRKVLITCPIHGNFKQSPNNHLKGSGCPSCCCSKGELSITNWLIDHGIAFDAEHSYSDLVSDLNYPLRFDFYIPSTNTCIEYDGMQHFKYIRGVHKSLDGFHRQQLHDNRKTEYCSSNCITLLRIPYTDFDNISDILTRELCV